MASSTKSIWKPSLASTSLTAFTDCTFTFIVELNIFDAPFYEANRRLKVIGGVHHRLKFSGAGAHLCARTDRISTVP